LFRCPTQGWHRLAIAQRGGKAQSILLRLPTGAAEPEEVLSTCVTEFTRDAVGNLLSLIDPGANVTAWEYDNLNRTILAGVAPVGIRGGGTGWQSPDGVWLSR
jgi:hypothetical protein